ncbi:MAG TPA: DUF3352 domain-containing protein [Nostocaceae cyanobacterium]|nr:DUF3352 domain-containing protein [Nostocaceae cyanobacterium]
MSESKSKFLALAVGTAVVVAVGGAAAYFYLKAPSGDATTALGNAKVVPQSALMAIYLNTDPQTWDKLKQFGTQEAQDLVGKSLQKFNQDLLKESKISYEQDLKPWVGGVMIAVLPPNTTKPAQSNSPTKAQPEPNVLIVVGIKDKVNALNFANKLKSQKDVKIQETDYKGEKIIETKGKGSPTYTTVLNNTHLLLAPEKQAVEKAIDTYKGEPSFVSKEGANTLLTKGVDLKDSLAQFYFPDYGNTVQQLIALNPQATQLPPTTLKQLKLFKSLVGGIGIDDAGIRFKAVANLDPQLNKYQSTNSPAKILSQFPAETFALVSGQGINRSWQALVEQSNQTPELKQGLAQARLQLQTAANIDLDKDIFGWMDGEFAFGAVASNQGLLAPVGFGGAFVFDTSDRKTADATLTKLDNLAKQQTLNVTQRNIGGKNVTEWQVPQQGALFAHGWLDQDTVFLAVGGPIADALADRKGESLESSNTFKTVTGSLQKPNAGYFYLDMDKTASLINKFATPSQPIAPEANAILNSIHGFAVTINSPDKSTSQMEMLLALKPSSGKK